MDVNIRSERRWGDTVLDVRAVVLANGDPGGDDAWGRETLRRADIVIAADGGAETALRWGRPADVVVGDFDSIDPAVWRRLGAERREMETFPRDKDQSDTEIALLAAKRLGATSIELLGALGGERLDHAMANVLLLALPELREIPVTLRDERHELRLLRGPGGVAFQGKMGDLVTLLPLTSRVTRVMTRGLRFALREGTLLLGRSRGVSNEMTGRRGSIRVERGKLLVIVHRV